MAARRSESALVAEVPAVLAGLLDLPERDLEIELNGGAAISADLLVRAAGHTFVIQVLSAVSPGPIVAHAERLALAVRQLHRKATPLLAVPFMTEAGRRASEGARMPWFDLSGNAHIVAPGLRVIVDGRPNRFRAPGRPASTFAPKSARVVRWLLMNPQRSFTQREIARATGMTEGFVSRIASRLERDSYVLRESSGALRVKDPQLLLDAWRDEYRFDKHTILQGHVAARSGDALTHFVSDTLSEAPTEHAATGLAAAWQLTHFATFRIATFFIAEPPSKSLRETLGFREEARGANLWLVVPNDRGVFQGSEPRDGVRCVHPVQAYVDLKAHPERAAEAADHLRPQLFTGRRHG